MELIRDHHVLIVVGETGSGKSTQIPQFLIEYNENTNLKVICTQPRRVAAMSVSSRVAAERNCELGFEVGYSVRFDNKCSNFTKIKYMTDGLLLREFMNDPLLKEYGAVMIDEAHERSISTDILLSLLKELVVVRDDFRLIIASATIDANSISKFFNCCPILTIPGRKFDVQIEHLEKPIDDYCDAAMQQILNLHKTTSKVQPCDILVFLTGESEIEELVDLLNSHEIKDLEVLPLYASLPQSKQARVFESYTNKRKVIISTNIAETSLTIDNIKYVIDSGKVKQNFFSPKTNTSSLQVVDISISSSDQRAGRAGRVCDGFCYRLYTESHYKYMMKNTTEPEITRSDFCPVYLLLLAMGIWPVHEFTFMQKPSYEYLKSAICSLYLIKAINSEGKLTELGQKISRIPCSPKIALTIIKSFNFGVSDAVITISSIFETGSSLFYIPKNNNKGIENYVRGFMSEYGDHLTALRVYKNWLEIDEGQRSEWCVRNHIQERTLKQAQNIKEQLIDVCDQLNLHNSVQQNEDVTNITKAFASGLFHNTAKLNSNGNFTSIFGNFEVFVHPECSIKLQYPRPEYVIYYEIVLTSNHFMRNVIQVSKGILTECMPHNLLSKL